MPGPAAPEEGRLLRDLALAIGEAAHLTGALETTLREIVGAFGWACGQAWTMPDRGDALTLRVGHYARPGLDGFRADSEGRSFAPNVGMPGTALATRRPVLLHEVLAASNAPRASAVAAAGLRGGLAFPVLAGEEVVAVLEFFDDAPVDPAPATVDLLTAAAAQLGGLFRRRRAEDFLKEAVSQLTATLDSTTDGVLVVDRQGRIRRSNRRFAEMWRLPLDVIESGDDDRAIAFVLHQLKDAEGFVSKVRELYARPEDESFDVLEFKDGRVFERYSRPQRIGEDVVGRVWSFRDVTERRAAETLAAERERHRRVYGETLVRLARDGGLLAGDRLVAVRAILEADARALGVERVSLWLYDAGRRHIVCEDLFERGPARHSAGVVLAEEDFPSYFAALEDGRHISAHEAETDPRTREFTESYLRPLGITSMLDAAVRLHGTIVGVVCHEHVGAPRRWTAEDEAFASSIADLVSLAFESAERRRAEEALRRQTALHELLLKAQSDLGEGMIVREGERFVYVNDAFCAMNGRTQEEILALPTFMDLVHPDDRAAMAESLRKRAAGELGDHYELPFTSLRDGRRRFIELSVKRLPSDPPLFVALFRDITERKEQEERLRLAEKMAALGLLVAGVAHDVNNPLAVARSNNDMILERVPPGAADEVRSLVESNARALRRIEATVRRLQRLAAPQARRLVPTQMGPLLQEAGQLVGERFRGRVTVDVQVADLPPLRGDPDLLADAITNLVVNAAEASPRGAVVRVRATREDGRAEPGPTGPCVVVRVEDDGPGFPDEVRERLFEPFTTTKAHGNMGLGLALARAVVQDHGGHIAADNRPGGGATVTLRVPLEPPK